MSTTPAWLLLLLAIASEVVGTSCLKLSAGMSRPLPTLVVLGSRDPLLPPGGRIRGMAALADGVVPHGLPLRGGGTAPPPTRGGEPPACHERR